MIDENDLSDKAALEAFLKDCRELEELKAYTADFNLFEAMGMVRQEIRHSHFLANLFNPRYGHGLDLHFLESFMKELLYEYSDSSPELSLLEFEIADYSDISVYRERWNIDLLLVSETHKHVFVIENKIDSGEHGKQLLTYEKRIDKEFPASKYKRVFIFLTLDGKEASRSKWLSASYSSLIEILEKILKYYGEGIPSSARIGIEHYITLFKRHFMEDSEIATLCRKIYQKHQKALDLIFEHRPDMITEVTTMCSDIISNELSRFTLDSRTKKLCRFIFDDWDKSDIQMQGEGWTKSRRTLMFETETRADKVILFLIIGPGEQGYRGKLFESLSKAPFKSLTNLSDKFSKIINFELLKFQDGEDLDDVLKRLREGFAKFTAEDWPKLEPLVADVLAEYQDTSTEIEVGEA